MTDMLGQITTNKALRYIEFLLLIATIVWAAAFLRSDVNNNEEKINSQETKLQVHETEAADTYARKDVLNVQLKAIEGELRKINEKLDNSNRQ